MKVKELVRLLKKYPPDCEVALASHDYDLGVTDSISDVDQLTQEEIDSSPESNTPAGTVVIRS